MKLVSLSGLKNSLPQQAGDIKKETRDEARARFSLFSFFAFVSPECGFIEMESFCLKHSSWLILSRGATTISPFRFLPPPFISPDAFHLVLISPVRQCLLVSDPLTTFPCTSLNGIFITYLAFSSQCSNERFKRAHITTQKEAQSSEHYS